jgi:hypothetical protein
MVLTAAVLNTWAGQAQADPGGFIYGKVTTRDGKTYTGVLRWGTQECFWDDLFNATKDDNPWERYAKDHEDRHEINKSRVRVFGLTITDFSELGFSSLDHMFISRFGDLKRIDVSRKGRSTVVMKSGTEYEVSGYGDVGETIQVMDESLGKLKIKWDEIREIEFLPTPASVKTPGYRLKGKVATDEMEFSGYVLWDAEECLSTDLLDGEGDAGDMSIEFGNIRSIERQSSQSCTVVLKDGREFELRGTNDVNHENRGIYVEDERYGKIQVGWEQLLKVTYEDNDGSTGKPYGDYQPARKLEGTVTAWGGKEYKGRLVFDFDEAETCDILNGKLDEMEFNVPFGNIVSLTPKGRHSSEVEFASGQNLRLDDSQDVTDNNYGLLIFKTEDDRNPQFVAWEDVEKINFQK